MSNVLIEPRPFRRQQVFTGTTFPTGWSMTDTTHYVDCPRCFAPKGFCCRTPKGQKTRVPHAERQTHYRNTIGQKEFDRRYKRSAKKP